MFGSRLARLQEWRQVVSSKPKTPLQRPVPAAVTSVPLDDNELRAYMRTAQAVGFEPATLLHARFILWLAQSGIPVFDYAAVSQYLDTESQRLHGRGGSWWWRPLRPVDIMNDLRWGRDPFYVGRMDDVGIYRSTDMYNPSNVMCRPYHLAIPLRVLSRVEQVVASFPTLKLFVTEMGLVERAVGGDPFICATERDMPRIIFDVWDEPGFSG